MHQTISDSAAKKKSVTKTIRLKYADDSRPGIERKRFGRGFRYVRPDGRVIRNKSILIRIRSLVIPPAWANVWICEFDNGHLQATGRDARGRKQYIYHPQWREARDKAKYDRLSAFARALPLIRRQVASDIRTHGLARKKVLATIVRLLETTLIRIGNDEYARTNGSFGLTTLLDRHARVHGDQIVFQFRGKSGKEHEIKIKAPQLAGIVKCCQELPGQQLFQYLDDGNQVVDVTSSDVNDYLREITGQDFTAKDFRTWGGTVLAAELLKESEAFSTATEARRNIVGAIAQVASRLGNTKAVCRKCYIHPLVFHAYEQRRLPAQLIVTTGSKRPQISKRLSIVERAVLSLLSMSGH